MTELHDAPAAGDVVTFPSPSRSAWSEALPAAAALARELCGIWQTVSADASIRSILQVMTDRARDLVGAQLAGASILPGDDWTRGVHVISLAERYAHWRTYAVPPEGRGVYAVVLRENRTLRLTQAELEAHPEWRGFGEHAASHPPLRGLLAAPIVAGGRAIGVLQLSDRLDGGDFGPAEEELLAVIGLMAGAAVERATAERQVRAVLDHSPAAIFLKDRSLRYVLANRRAAEWSGLADAMELLGRRDADFVPAPEAARREREDRDVLASGRDFDEELGGQWPDPDRMLHVQVFPVLDEDASPIGVGGIVSDITAHRSAEAALARSERRYRQLFENALDAILVADDEGRYVDANPAACELLGMSREEVLERSVADVVVDLSSGLETDEAWSGFVVEGQPERADLTRGYVRLRRADGTVREAEFAAAPNAAPGLHLSVLRDATERRRFDRLARQREAILAALMQMPAATPLEAQARAVCGAIVERGDFTAAALFSVEPDERVMLVGLATDQPGGAGLPVLMDADTSGRVLAAAAGGPWVDDWSTAGEAVRAIVEQIGVRVWAWAPLSIDGHLVGLLVAGDPGTPADAHDRLRYIGELGAIVAASSLGRALAQHHALAASRARIRAVIDAAAFHSVFQPIVDLESGAPVAYEALTRFADGTPPNEVFAEAAACGLSLELEIATARAALEAAGPLPANRWIEINVSPDLITAGEPLQSLLRELGFGVVLEVTEHQPVTDYPAVRRSVRDLGEHVRLAVDDAGAGFASFRHILELRPSIVKLDRALIAGIDRDPARQALVAGMVHFAARLDVMLMAEGVETPGERVALLELGIHRAQGFLFGRPATAAELSPIRAAAAG